MRRELDPAAIRAYVDRDWLAVRENKRAYWRARLRQGDLAEALAVSEQLRITPTEHAREADLEAHQRLAATFAKVRAAARPARRRAVRVR